MAKKNTPEVTVSANKVKKFKRALKKGYRTGGTGNPNEPSAKHVYSNGFLAGEAGDSKYHKTIQTSRKDPEATGSNDRDVAKLLYERRVAKKSRGHGGTLSQHD